MKVRISATIANEYDSRAVYGDVIPWKRGRFEAGTYEVTPTVAAELQADAQMYADREHDGVPASILTAYRALARQLRVETCSYCRKGFQVGAPMLAHRAVCAARREMLDDDDGGA